MFDPNTIYLASDPALAVIASYSTMAHWRVQGRGPAFVKLGPRRVGRIGRILNAWLEAQTVRPTNGAQAAIAE